MVVSRTHDAGHEGWEFGKEQPEMTTCSTWMRSLTDLGRFGVGHRFIQFSSGDVHEVVEEVALKSARKKRWCLHNTESEYHPL